MDSPAPRKLRLFRKSRERRGSVANTADINLDTLVALQVRHTAADIHFLPIPKQISQLLPQDVARKPHEGSDTLSEQVSEHVSEPVSQAAFAAFKQEVDAEISLRNAEMADLKACVATMEKDIALIRQAMRRIKALVIAGSFFVLAWTISVTLFL